MNGRKNKNEPAQITALKAVTYARVSSKEQEKEGFSIPAQQKLLQSYAQANRIDIVRAFVDIETAKQTGRTNFEEMVRFLKNATQHSGCPGRKTDRLYRNLKDWVTLTWISQTYRCIEAENLRKMLCCNSFSEVQESPDADRVYAEAV